ncbi:hypothetical protein V8F20_008293 [Naviculisporaceae sp. PSN 640]
MDAPTESPESQPVIIESTVRARLRDVSEALVVQANKTTFAIGGMVHLDKHSSVAIRYDTIAQVNHCRKVSFPVDPNDPNSTAAFAKFLEDSERATFGKGGESVYDETYRKAGKMSAERFATSFNLSEWGIMPAVSSALVHGPGHGGIKAELYNVNVYSGPSGKFKPHVDTPRSTAQVGSLVICLPSPHEGGQLAVRHQGREVIFDWAAQASSADPLTVQWAAFFSDCEHEVLQVTAGHRVTLTYNLHWAPQMTRQIAEVLQPEQLAFYPALKGLLSLPDFLPQGGWVGFTCAHAYPHRSNAMAKTLHHNLKGIDMLVFQALKQLTGPRGKVHVTDVVDDLNFGHYLKSLYESSVEFGEMEPFDYRPAVGNRPLHGPWLAQKLYQTDIPDVTKPKEFSGVMEYSDHDRIDWIFVTEIRATGWKRKDVFWLNHDPAEEKKNRELAAAYMMFGNEPSLQAFYSAAVIIAYVHKGPGTSAKLGNDTGNLSDAESSSDVAGM